MTDKYLITIDKIINNPKKPKHKKSIVVVQPLIELLIMKL